jgi:hypothetical protein
MISNKKDINALTFHGARRTTCPFVFAIELYKLGTHGITILIWICHVVPVFAIVVGRADIVSFTRQQRRLDHRRR